MEASTMLYGLIGTTQEDGAAEAQAGTGPSATRPAGRRPGRRPKLSGPQQAMLVDEVLSGRRTAAQMARHCGVSEPTVSRICSWRL